jgi:hypothetical protein
LSHIVTIKTEVRDAAAVRAACRRLGLTEPVLSLHRGDESFAGLGGLDALKSFCVQGYDWNLRLASDFEDRAVLLVVVPTLRAR